MSKNFFENSNLTVMIDLLGATLYTYYLSYFGTIVNCGNFFQPKKIQMHQIVMVIREVSLWLMTFRFQKMFLLWYLFTVNQK